MDREISKREELHCDTGSNRFRSYVQHVPQGMFVTDAQGRYLEVNPAACCITGYSAAELLERSIVDLLPANAVAAGREAFARLLAEGNYHGEFPFVGKGGRVGWWSIQATRLTADRYLGFATDMTARKLAEVELLHERGFRQSLLDAAPVIVLVLDLQGQVVYINRFLEELCGYSLAEVRGADWFATFLPERIREEVRELFAMALSRSPTRGYRNCIVTRDGAERLIEWNDECLRGGDGQVAGLVAIGQDLTDRQQAEDSLRAKKQELRESEERLRLALASANQGLWDIHVPTGEVVVSAEYATMLGFDPARFRESEAGWLNRLHPDDRALAAEKYRRYLAGESDEYCTEFRLRTRTGDWKWVLSKGRIVSRDAQGKPLRMIGTHTDITPLKEVEQSLSQRNAAIEASINGVALTDADGRLTYVNSAFLRMWGYDRADEVLGRSAMAFWVEPALAAGVVEELIVNSRWFGELAARRRDGSHFVTQLSATLIRDAQQRPVSMMASFVDVSEQKQHERKLRESELHLRAVLDSSPECVKVVSENGILLEMNRAGLAMIEADSIDDVCERDIGERILPEYRDLFRAALARTAADERTTIRYEIEGLRGTHRWCEQSSVVLRDMRRQQSTVKVLAVTRDITERVEAERRLQDSEERYRSLFDAMTEAFALHEVVCDEEGRAVDYRHVDVNQAYERLLGCPRTEIIGRLRSQQDGPDAHFWIEQFGRVALEGQPLCCEYMNPESKRYWIVRAFQTKPGEFGALFTEITQRKLAEASLRDNEERLRLFRTLINLSSDAIFVVDPPTGRLLDVNDRACLRLGYARDELLSMSVPEINPAMRDEAQWKQLVHEISCQGEVLLESRHRRRDGSLLPVEINVSQVTVESASYLIAVARDISERKRTEQLLEIFVENAPASVAMFDRDMRYLAHSRRWITDYRLPAQSLVGRSHYEVFPEITERWREIHRRCLAGTAERCEVDEFLRADGRVEYLCWEIQPWRTASGEIGGVVFFTELITARVLAERALKESELRLEEAQRIAHVGNWVWEISTDTISWSDEVYQIFGHPPQSFVPRYQHEFLAAIHPEDRASIMAAMDQSLRSGAPYTIEHRVLRPDGAERYVREHGLIHTDASGTPQRMVGTVQDITERKLAEQQMNRLRDEMAHMARVAAIGELSAGIAHELNQPLAAIANFAFALRTLLERQAPEFLGPAGGDCLRLSHEIEKQAVRGGDIVRRLQEMVRKRTTQRASVPLESLVREVLGLLAGELRNAQIQLTVDTPTGFPEIYVDALQIQQVLFNLCRNAIQALRHLATDRRLSISAQRESDTWVMICVRDNGPGVNPELREQIFAPFISSKPEGLGFGLAISRRIVESHGGKLWVSDTSPGAEFCCRLPICAAS